MELNSVYKQVLLDADADEWLVFFVPQRIDEHGVVEGMSYIRADCLDGDFKEPESFVQLAQGTWCETSSCAEVRMDPLTEEDGEIYWGLRAKLDDSDVFQATVVLEEEPREVV